MYIISSFFLSFAENFSNVNLIIEQGNTSSKVAVYHRGRMETSFICKDLGISFLRSLFDQYELTAGILSSVIRTDETLITFLKAKLPRFLVLDETVALPITVCYETPGTLGRDRLAAAVGANYLQPGKNILVIDAGTAVTYEIIEASGTYLGGNISPGMTTRFKALNAFTCQLPLLEEEEQVPLIGTSTDSAIRAGVVNGMVYEMDGYVRIWREKYPDLLVFLTGGHSFYFERRLKNSIFADINLVLTGLNRILEYNVEN